MREFDKLYLFSVMCMKVHGTFPYTKRDIFWFAHYLSNNLLMASIFVLMVYNVIVYDLKAGDFGQICKNGVLCFLYLIGGLQSLTLIYHKNNLTILIENMERDYKLPDLTTEQHEILTNYKEHGSRTCVQWLFLIGSTIILFVLKNVFLMVYYYCIGETHLVMFYELNFPDFIEPLRRYLVVFWIIYAMQSIYGFLAGAMYVSFVPLGPIFMLHACGQIDQMILKCKQMLVEQNKDVVLVTLREIIMQSQYVYRFVEIINTCFKLSYELTLKGSTLILSVTCYAFVDSLKKGQISVEFLTLIISGALISSTPCYYSDMLMDKADDFRLALYSSGWDRRGLRREANSVSVMLERAQRPVAIRSIFRTLCLEALSEVFHQAYALFNLMNAMWA